MTELVQRSALSIQSLHRSGQVPEDEIQKHPHSQTGSDKRTVSTLSSSPDDSSDSSDLNEGQKVLNQLETGERREFENATGESFALKAEFATDFSKAFAFIHNTGRCNPEPPCHRAEGCASSLRGIPSLREFPAGAHGSNNNKQPPRSLAEKQSIQPRQLVVPRVIRIAPPQGRDSNSLHQEFIAGNGTEFESRQSVVRPQPLKTVFVHRDTRVDNNSLVGGVGVVACPPEVDKGRSRQHYLPPLDAFRMAPLPSRMKQQDGVGSGQHGYAVSNGAVQQPPQQQLPGRQHGQARTQHHHLRQTSPAASHASSRRSTSRGGGSAATSEVSSPKTTPLFQRLVSDEVQELKSYARIIETQNRKIAELERVHADQENRLEVQNNRRIDLERMLEERERQWEDRIAELQRECNGWKEKVESERVLNDRLREDLDRQNKIIQQMVHRKFDPTTREAISHSVRNVRASDRHPTMSTSTMRQSQHSNGELAQAHRQQSPQQILAASGSVEAVRERNVTNALQDFFGL